MKQAPSKHHAWRWVPAPLVCVAAASLLAWLYAPYGYNGLDDGFIQALSWRVVNGQLPYLDFVYIRPPGSVFLHALPLVMLPRGLQVIFERWWFFVAVAAYSFMAAAILTRHFDLRAWRLPRHALGLLFFVASVQDFPPMAWHTVDGILFAVLAAFCVCSSRGTPGLVIGAVCAVLAAACKQPFFAVPPAIWAYVAFARGRRDAAIVGAFMAAAVGLALAALSGGGMLREALDQCTAQTRLASLFHAGVVSYARGAAYMAVPLALAFVGTAAWRLLTGRVARLAGVAYALVVGIFVADIALTLVERRFLTPAFNYPGALFCIAGLTLLAEARRRDAAGAPDRRGLAALALLLLVAWCGSVSWGYPTPVLFSAPLWFGTFYCAATYLRAAPRRLVALALPLALVAQFAGYRYPYREAPRAALTEHLGDVLGTLDHVYSSAANRDRFAELQQLHERYPRFTVLPALPSANYLTGTLPPVGVDWARDSELGGRAESLIAELEASGAHVFLERAAEPLCETGPGCSALARHVVARWQVIEEGSHFRVYRLPGPGS